MSTNTTSVDDLLAALLPCWKLRLQGWCLDGSLITAARQALLLPEIPATLQDLVEQWANGEFSALPPIMPLSSREMRGAAGAYGINSRSIYLNADWLLTATPDEVLTVLSEELGHHLDGMLNSRDAPGDEGELFAALLSDEGLISSDWRGHWSDVNDNCLLSIAGQLLAVEQATMSRPPIPAATPGRTRGEWRNTTAFAALKADGSVVTWGGESPFVWGGAGGDSSGVAAQLGSGVTHIFSNRLAFAALKSDGSVVTWGFSVTGGDSSGVAGPLSSGVVRIFSDGSSFAALKADGSVVTWGEPTYGGNSSAVASELSSGVVEIFSTSGAFAALKSDGSVVTWGTSDSGGDSRGVAGKLSSGVVQIFCTYYAFAALKADGSVVTWGAPTYGGNSSGVASELSSGVLQIFSNREAFAALMSNGSIVTWGEPSTGGDSSAVAGLLSSGVTRIYSNVVAFVALKADGSIVTWGEPSRGGNSSAVAGQLSSGVTDIFSNDYAFAALKADGSVVTWGLNWAGGDSSEVAGQLSSGVTKIYSNDYAFAALKADGSVVSWGHSLRGGNSSGVAGQLTNVVALANPFTDDKIVELDNIVNLAISPAWIPEDSGVNIVYTFTRSGDLSKELKVNFSVSGSASIGSDFSGIAANDGPQTVTFAAGSAITNVVVDPQEDAEIEADESLLLTLLPGADYRIGTTAAVEAKILNDDPDVYTAGPTTIRGVNLGGTSLGYAIRTSDQALVQITYPDGYVSAHNPGNGWVAAAATDSPNGSTLYWRTTSNGPVARWELNGSGAYTSGYLLSSTQLSLEEASLGLDLNGDDYIPCPMLNNGNLGRTPHGYVLRSLGGALIRVSTPAGVTPEINRTRSGVVTPMRRTARLMAQR
ncbi:MAG: hypothetical protein ACK550_09980 [Synechococcaceae cyanobacterium]|jgi:hypothetical protein